MDINISGSYYLHVILLLFNLYEFSLYTTFGKVLKSFFHILNIIAEFYYTISIKIWKEGTDAG